MLGGQAKPTRQRTSSNRSRAGCSTCKRRRVKCDEGRPHCLRCLRADLACEGYPDASISTSTPRATTRNRINPKPLILPKTNRDLLLDTARPTATLPGETEVENRYLRYFHEQTMGGFQSAFDWTLWNRLVLQGCHHESFVRDAVVAIGALHKSLCTISSVAPEARPDPEKPMAELHREYAYRTYGRALRKMQLAINAGAGPRLALVACLLVVCFESHMGNRYKAVAHAQYGLQILQQWNGHSTSGEPPKVEDEIIDAFRNLDIQIATINDRRTPEVHQRLLETHTALARSMPSCFETLDEARRYWHIVMLRSCHFLATTWARTQSHLLTREFQTKIPGSVTTTVGENIHTSSFTVDDVIRAGHRRFREEMDHWLTAFEPILHRIRRVGRNTLREHVAATMLQIQALTAKVNLAGVIITQEILWDQFLPEFKDIVRFAEDIVAVRLSNSAFDHYWAGSFNLDLGLVVPLFLVLLRCRDPVLRRRAIGILKSWHQECWWDPLLITAIAQFIMAIEEKGMVDGFIPEPSRAILTGKRHKPTDRALIIQCVQRTGGPGGGLKWTEGLVRW